jgi:two-component system alkaline phosphatase synthesis response regulator PhoP
LEGKAKILLVDDDADFVESTRMILESKQYEIITAVNGEEALRKARAEKPDLILLDIIMPVEDGFTAAEQLKKDETLSTIPVLMLTSYGSKGAGTGIPRSRGMQLEAEDYIAKPVTPQDLLAAVEKYLKKLGFH